MTNQSLPAPPDAHVDAWLARRSFGPAALPSAVETARRARARGVTIGVALPALNEAATIGAICRSIRDELMHRTGLVSQLVVIDGSSSDATAQVARGAGAQVVFAEEALPYLPPVQGKGESLWRSLAVLDTDIVCWVDADIRNFEPHFVARLVAPLVYDDDIAFVKATYRRPLAIGGVLVPDRGGRVTERFARPLLNALFPELRGIRQPLAGEYAGRRDVLKRVPFFSGYSVEAGLLIDLLGEVGLDGIAQVDLGERVHRNRPMEQLVPMADSIASTILRRAAAWGRIDAAPHRFATTETERPPMRALESDEVSV